MVRTIVRSEHHAPAAFHAYGKRRGIMMMDCTMSRAEREDLHQVHDAVEAMQPPGSSKTGRALGGRSSARFFWACGDESRAEEILPWLVLRIGGVFPPALP